MANLKAELTWDDLELFPVWHFDPETEMFRPLEDLNHSIESVEEVHFRAIFTTPHGFELVGSVTGAGETAIGIFRNKRWYAANRNWIQTSADQLSQLIKDSPELEVDDFHQLLPLRFEIKIGLEPFVDREGLFDLSKFRGQYT
jgi:hypothetical protein